MRRREISPVPMSVWGLCEENVLLKRKITGQDGVTCAKPMRPNLDNTRPDCNFHLSQKRILITWSESFWSSPSKVICHLGGPPPSPFRKKRQSAWQKSFILTLTMWLSWLEPPPHTTKGCGLIPSQGVCGRQPIDLSLSPVNKHILRWELKKNKKTLLHSLLSKRMSWPKNNLLFSFLNIFYWLCFYSCPIFFPLYSPPSYTPPPTIIAPFGSCPWVVHISSLASTFPILFLTSPCLFCIYH